MTRFGESARPIVTAFGALGLCISVVACGFSSASSPETPTPEPQTKETQTPEAQTKEVKRPDAADSPLRVAFLGDSYVVGEGAKDPGKTRWTARVSVESGWTEVNLGLGGTGYTTPGPEEKSTTYVQRVGTVADANPDVVVVSGGRNDLDAPPNRIRVAATELFKALDRIQGSPPVVVVGPLWDASKQPAALAAATRAIKEAARRVEVEFVAVPQQPLVGRPQLIAGDGLHPNADGYRVIAEYLAPRLRDALEAE